MQHSALPAIRQLRRLNKEIVVAHKHLLVESAAREKTLYGAQALVDAMGME